MTHTALLNVENLAVHFPIGDGLFRRASGSVKAVDGVSFSLNEGETLGLVGESGCGKSTLGNAILRLVDATAGKILFKGEDLSTLKSERLRQARFHMQMIFQDPYASLNPRMLVGDSIGEPLLVHGLLQGEELRARVISLFERVGLGREHIDRYPHQFSGGQRQRLVIARALALSPSLIVCDEPVSALDVSVRSQILNLLVELQRSMGLAYLLISHDLSVVRHISDRVAVMYLGRIVEMADRDTLYLSPQHPYTQALMSAIPDPVSRAKRSRQRIVLSGEVPSPSNPPSGCTFHTRCPIARASCATSAPTLEIKSNGAKVACHLVD
ncbi:MAG: dipeptide ABC transporter ATP-binding protein [Alphaproteobacteria bacterium]|nr:dipeptide ABC transporter ATP-binding protein [Alphaproteobacteria bacterium]